MWATRLMRDYLKDAIKVTTDTLRKDMIHRFLRAKVGFKEVELIADQMVKQQKSSKGTREDKYDIVKCLMKKKQNDAEKCLKMSKHKLNESKTSLNKTVRKETIAREEFMEIVDIELNNEWKSGKSKTNDKVDWAVRKYCSKPKPEEVFKGVIVSDKLLEEYETSKHQKMIPKPLFIVISKLIKNSETELSKCSIKERWESMRESRKLEESKALKEIKEIDPEKEHKGTNNKVYDPETKTMDMRNLRATDLKNNKRVKLPELEGDATEIIRKNVRGALKEVFIRYKTKNCDKFGNILKNNLTTKQVEAIRNLKSQMAEDALVCYKTDKTGKLALDTIENYTEKMKKHIKDDEIITYKELKKIENDFNKQSDYWSSRIV